MITLSKRSALELMPILKRRASSYDALSFLDKASEIIVFGSIAASVAKSNSDLDVLVVSDRWKSFKTERLDIVGLSKEDFNSDRWQSSELASHIRQYGIPLKGDIKWTVDHISQEAIDAKARRIRAFLSSLPRSWKQLDEVFRIKYSTKLRRESQRLILLESNIAIPPTRLLDEEWQIRFGSNFSVIQRLKGLNQGQDSKVFEDLNRRIYEQLSHDYRIAASTSA